MKRGRLFTAAVLLVAAVFLAVTLGIYAEDNKYASYAALSYSAKSSYTVTGVFLREERVQKISGSAVWYLTADGERVSNNQELARIYSKSADVSAARKSLLASRELEDIDESAKLTDSVTAAAVTPDTILKQISESDRRLKVYTATGDAEGAARERSELNVLLNKYKSCFEKVNYSASRAALTAAAETQKNMAGSYTTFANGYPGFFFSYSDGFEHLSPSQVLSDFTVERAMSLIADTKSSEIRGDAKIVTQYRWYYVFTMPTSKAVLLPSGSVTISFPGISGALIDARIEAVEKQAGAEGITAVCVSSMAEMELLGACRNEQAEIIFSSTTGLRVPSKAIRSQVDADGREVLGVYVAVGPRMEFRKVEILINEGDFIVCKINEKSGWLRIYDEVITQGKNLFDGKTL